MTSRFPRTDRITSVNTNTMDHYMFSHEDSFGGASNSQATMQPVRDDDTLADSIARRLEEQAAAARDA